MPRTVLLAVDAKFERYLAVGVACSLIVHALILLILRTTDPAPIPRTITVDIVFSQPQSSAEPRRQIVTPPEERTRSESAPDTDLLSEFDARAPREQIMRGAPDAGPAIGEESPAPPQQAPAAPRPQRAEAPPARRAPAERQPTRRQTSSPPKLTLDRGTLLREFGAGEPQPKAARLDEALASQSPEIGAGYEPFSRPRGSGARFMGQAGSSDHLPHLPDGDITLLNTKANQFAVFVRRVATQVFGQMRLTGWDHLRAQDVRAVQDFATVTAVLSLDGKLLRVEVESSSGNSRFDTVLKDAVNRGARDPNPPPEAALADGNIHFVFQSRSWVQLVSDPRSGRVFERRWLLLGTGLK